MRKATTEIVLDILQATYPTLPMHEAFGHDPFQMLVAVILSQRSRDNITVPIAQTLFARASTPYELCSLAQSELEAIIKPIGFHHTKASAVKKLSAIVVERFNGFVPTTEQELLSLPHVGRKTANIILTCFFHTPQIAVDIHVHRITNRLGWVHTTDVRETETQLTHLIPRSYHEVVNRVFVAHGQQCCMPRSPKCTQCPIANYCERIGVSNRKQSTT